MLRQQIDDAVLRAVQVLIAQGGYRQYGGLQSEQLVAELKTRLDAAEVLLTSSGTAAVELTLRAAGIGEGDEVILAGYDYPGNFWAIERVGARPILVDTLVHSWRIDPEWLDTALAGSPPGRCKALLVSHLHGELQDVGELRAWCDAHGLLLVEDACQSMGGQIGRKPAGSLGHVGIISFGGGKTLSAGRGGALITGDAMLAQRARIAAGAGSGPYTMSELQAAAVLAQLPWLEAIVDACRTYFAELSHCVTAKNSLQFPFARCSSGASFYQAGMLLDYGRPTSIPVSVMSEEAGHASQQSKTSAFISGLRALGIPAGSGFSGFHRRSGRRCRRVCPLRHVSELVESTCTIHHSAALEQKLSAGQIAESIDSLIIQLLSN